MEVLVDDQWVKTRMEMNLAREWYLVGTPYCGDLEYVRARICLLYTSYRENQSNESEGNYFDRRTKQLL